MVNKELCVTRERLKAYTIGELTPGEIETVSNHLETCPLCSRDVETLDGETDAMTLQLQRIADKLQAPSDPEVLRIEESAMELLAASQVVERGDWKPFPVSDVIKPVPSQEAATLQRGDRLGEFMIEDTIAQGGMGIVYRAAHRWPQIKKPFALKTILPKYMTDSTAIDRFARGAAAAIDLQHNNIVQVSIAGEDRGYSFLVMDYIDGLDLKKILENFGPLQVPDACDVICQAARALQYAHERGVVHRDVKPANLMLTGPILKLTDFGLGKLREGLGSDAKRDILTKHSGTRMLNTQGIMGTPDYMSPEQWKNTAAVTIQADIYSLGCTFYQLLAGHAPFHNEETIDEKERAHLTEDPKPIPLLQDRRWKHVEVVLNKMLAKDCENRYQTPQQIVDELTPLSHGSDLRGVANGVRKQSAWVQEKPMVRRAVLAFCVLLGVNILLCVALTYALITQYNGTTDSADRERNSIVVSTPSYSPEQLVVFQADIGTFYEQHESWRVARGAPLDVELQRTQEGVQYKLVDGILKVSYEYLGGDYCSARFMIRSAKFSRDNRLHLSNYRYGYLSLRVTPVLTGSNQPLHGRPPGFGVELVRDNEPFLQVPLQFSEEFFDETSGWYEYLIPLDTAFQGEDDTVDQVLLTFSDMYESGQRGAIHLEQIELIKSR